MDANLLSSTLNASPAPSNPAVQGATPAGVASGAVPDTALRGADFANLLSSMLADPKRQVVAAAGLAEAGLQALPLGPQIEVITAAKPVPDSGSLMAFARSQGLDESTLASLFGDMAAPAPAGVSGLSATSATVGAGYFLAGQAALAQAALGQAQVGGLLIKPELTTTTASIPIPDPQLASLTVLSASPLALQAPVNPTVPASDSDQTPAVDSSFKPDPSAVPAAYFLSTALLVPHSTSQPSLSVLGTPLEVKPAALPALIGCGPPVDQFLLLCIVHAPPDRPEAALRGR